MERSIMDEITQYINEESVRGDLARVLAEIVADYQAGSITVEEKNELVHAIVESYKADQLANDEVALRWAVSAATVVASIV